MNYLDIHTHTHYDDPEVVCVVNVFAQERDKLGLPALFSVGLHPWHIDEAGWENQIENLQASALHPNVIAIGETGLDKTIRIPYTMQCRVFEKHLLMAEKMQKPVIIHCVRSYSELLAYRKKADLSIPWIFHWFNSTLQTAEALISKNCYLSFGHMLFNEQSKAFRVFKDIPPERVFFETDDAGYRIQQVYERAALLSHIPPGQLKNQIMDNFVRCFKR
jgi:TatD DNase family protein